MGNDTQHQAEGVARDDQALVLRTEGVSFAGIAKRLGYERASHAVNGFNRALRRRPEPEQDELRKQEMARLDGLAARAEAKAAGDDAELTRRMRAVDALRTRLLAP